MKKLLIDQKFDRNFWADKPNENKADACWEKIWISIRKDSYI